MFGTLQAKLIALGLALVLLAGAVLFVFNKGKEIGRVEGAAEQLQTDRQQFEQDRQAFLQQLEKYKADEEAAKVVIQAKDQQLMLLQQSRVAGRQAVAKLPDADLNKALHENLGNPPTDSPPTLQETRQIVEILVDYPKVVKQSEVLAEKIDALDRRVTAVEQQRDAALTAYNRLVPLYAKAYNASQKKHSKFVKIITFGLVRDKHLDLPDPVTLEHP